MISSDQSASLRAAIAVERATVKWYGHLLTLTTDSTIAQRIRAMVACHERRIEDRMSELDERSIYAARAEAEAGIERADRALEEAGREHSPLAPYITRYVARRRAYAATAASLAATIERLERAYDA